MIARKRQQDQPQLDHRQQDHRQQGLRLLIAGGGTGGHIVPGLSLAQQAQQSVAGKTPAAWIGWVGDPDRLESQMVPRAGLPLFGCGLGRPRLRQPRWWLQAMGRAVDCWRLLVIQRPHVVVALGGYPALLPALLAALLRKPVVLLESNALPGKTNRLLGRLAQVAVVHFPDARRFFPYCRSVASGNPLPSRIVAQPRAVAKPLTLLVMGGSLSAAMVNEAAYALGDEIADKLPKDSWRVIHLAGKDAVVEAERRWQQAGIDAEVFDFCHDMPRVYAEADVVLGRAGASSCAELALAGLASVLVPLPSAADDHQTVNAEALAQRGAAVLVPQPATADQLAMNLLPVFTDFTEHPTRLRAMGVRARALAKPHAAGAAWRLVAAVAGGALRRIDAETVSAS